MGDEWIDNLMVDHPRAMRLGQVQVEEERRFGDPIEWEIRHDAHREEIDNREGAKHRPVDQPDSVVVGSHGSDGLETKGNWVSIVSSLERD
ncbi:hypothetical protein GCK72_008437 [Caenorhabditis remanei]|uniref:Uncharacterized protein n=1 Tax=Caenorhabditis remanei TaxID=31234 RepID=A0A6A5GZQ9_CAERE|nr:hypothetical protein GCK72_008437 [Caenorhabditis remanei]KAF1760191.1 hypothetical protein GCK72_008437 [Caenorhabditis remanei]